MGILSLLGLDDDDQGTQQAENAPAQDIPTSQPIAPAIQPPVPAAADAPHTEDGDTDTADAKLAPVSANPTLRDYLLNKDKSLADRYAEMASDTSGVQKAKDDAAHTKLSSGLMEGLATMFQGQGKADTGFYQQLRQDANSKVGQAQQQQQQNLANLTEVGKLDQESKVQTQQAAEWKHEKDLQDPKSDSSVALRGFMSSLGITVPDNASYADMSKVYGGVIQAHEAEQGRIQAAQQSAAMRGLMLQSQMQRQKELADNKMDQQVNAATQKMGSDLDPSKGRNGTLGMASQKVANAQALQALANGQGDNLDQRQTEELAIGLNKLLSGSGVPNSAQVKALVPDTVAGNAQKLKEWLMNDPQGLNQQAFVQKMMGTVNREADVANQQIKQYQVGKLGGHQWLKQHNPDAYNQVLSSYDIDPSEIDEKGHYSPKPKTPDIGAGGGPGGIPLAPGAQKQTPPPAPSPDDQQALEWLKANPSDPHAADVTAKLKQKGLL